MFQVQRVAVIVASGAAAIFVFTFCLFGRKILSIFGKKKKKHTQKNPSLVASFLVTRPLNRKQIFFSLALGTSQLSLIMECGRHVGMQHGRWHGGGRDSKRGTQQFGDSFNGGQLSFSHAGASGGRGRGLKRGGGGDMKSFTKSRRVGTTNPMRKKSVSKC